VSFDPLVLGKQIVGKAVEQYLNTFLPSKVRDIELGLVGSMHNL
jgi:hypothetical protein